ncbi:MAG TPA: putative oxidoreductase C-terminal domain-containing protein [Bryobacteraceae bacterium]|nr:putative oxidoreductase C-terminal domain-containing protein [Bryobacteraceae bacterium]
MTALPQSAPSAEKYRLITIDPGHFHAALMQKEMYPQVSKRATVFAPLGPDLAEHLKRVALFNSRKDNPTSWELDIHTSPDFMKRALSGPAGGIVILSGRNSVKMERISASVEAGFNVLADKPWTLASADMPKLQAALELAERKGLVAYDIMTERYEMTSVTARELVRDPAVFGKFLPGTEQEPGVSMESIHYIMKLVAGAPNLRPLSFFDINEQGEGLSDVGTHLVDLAQWTLYPDQNIDWRSDIKMLGARRWPTVMSKDEFTRVTGEREFPAVLAPWVKQGRLEYYCNNEVSYALRGVRVKMNVLWNYEAPPGQGDKYEAIFRGTKARVEIRQGKDENFRPEVYVVPAPGADRQAVAAAVKARIATLAKQHPGLTTEGKGQEIRVLIPDAVRTGHEAHFAEVTRHFFDYLKSPKSMPAWEKSYMLAKYYVSTKGVEMSREAGAKK